MPAGSSSPTMATTRGPCSTTSGTRTFSTPSDTPKWRPTDSKTFGGTDDGGAGSITPARKIVPFEKDDAPYHRDHSPTGGRTLRALRSRGPMPANRHLSRPDIVRSGASRRRHALPRLALLRPDRSIDLHHQPVRLALGRLDHRESGSRYCCRFYHPLDHFDRTACLRFKQGLDVLDHGLKLLVRQLLDQVAVLDLVLPRAQQRQNLQVSARLGSAHTFNRLRTAVPEVSEQSRNKLPVQLLTVTRADRTASRVDDVLGRAEKQEPLGLERVLEDRDDVVLQLAVEYEWIVPSQSGKGRYKVRAISKRKFKCNCPDHRTSAEDRAAGTHPSRGRCRSCSPPCPRRSNTSGPANSAPWR